ncbi:HNH endonuclease signature motif containing protein [Cronobacter sakazakii]|uniref:HNH endonuclease signature motif containing protein n=1 Tax=Cronobacter sakazakii TaxID=28141 RepID=UPI003519099A
MNDLIKRLEDEQDLSETELIQLAGLQGKIVAGDIASKAKKFTDDQKSMIFINTALQSAIKCPICNGYLDTTKSVSYDHIIRVREGGVGSYNNGQLTHPYCNQAIKN